MNLDATSAMGVNPLTDLLKLPADDGVEIAIALWESLSEAERDCAFDLTDEQRAELDRRWEGPQPNRGATVTWSQVRKKLLG